MSTPDRDIESFEITWEGIRIGIYFERNWLGSPPSDYHPSHLEVRAIVPENARLPITETGYRSHFLSDKVVDAAGGPVAYVMEALTEAARTKGWRAYVGAQKQLSLF